MLAGHTEWFREGVEDLERAERNASLGDLKAAFFFLHQAVEKLLKALLMKRGVFLRTHRIDDLLREAASEYAALRRLTEEERDLLASLTIHYSAARYPDARVRYRVSPEFYADPSNYERALRAVRRLVKLAEEALRDCDRDLGTDELGRPARRLLEEYVGKLCRRVDLMGVVAFGSRVRGDYKPWSDLDVVVIVREVPELPLEEPYKTFSHPLIDYRLYTVEEALRALDQGDVTLLIALSEGEVIYDAGAVSELRRRLRERWDVSIDRRRGRYVFRRVARGARGQPSAAPPP